MIQIVNILPPVDVKAITETSESKFYTLETSSNRPFVLVRANANVGGNKQEDQWHWVSLGSVKNRKTGFVTFQEAINTEVAVDENIVKEHDTLYATFKYLGERAKVYQPDS